MKHGIQDILLKTAFEMGAFEAKIFQISDICFDPRTLLKCLFGCRAGYHYCPSPKDATNSLTYMEIMKKYQWGIIIRSGDLALGQKITLALESKAFLAGYHFAFGATECTICPKCSKPEGHDCRNRRDLRPPLYSLGIDVYSTVRGLGWELEVVQKKGDPAQNITAVFVE